MTKNLKLNFIFYFVFSAIVIAWHTLTNFFEGVGINFIALLGLIFATVLIMLKDKYPIKRTKDLFIISCSLAVLELIVFFACEFGHGETIKGFIIYQNIISAFGILFLIYTMFRFALELTNKKVGFIEFMLGNGKKSPKIKKSKEISNGSLEEKPNSKQDDFKSETDENIVIIETEE